MQCRLFAHFSCPVRANFADCFKGSLADEPQKESAKLAQSACTGKKQSRATEHQVRNWRALLNWVSSQHSVPIRPCKTPTHHVEGHLWKVIVLALNHTLETRDGVLDVHVLSWRAGKDLSHL